MPYRAAKISFDGSHYIATPKENFPQGHKRRRAARPLSVEESEKKEQFEAAYKESQQLPKKERKAYMRKAMEETIPDKEQRKEYVERNNERKKTNAIRRKVRLAKKAYLQEWSFFCTFTATYGRKFPKIAPQYVQTSCRAQRLETHRRMGARRRERKVAFSRYLLHSAGRHGRRDRRNKGLQYQRPPNADGVPKHLLSRTVRA